MIIKKELTIKTKDNNNWIEINNICTKAQQFRIILLITLVSTTVAITETLIKVRKHSNSDKISLKN